MGLKEMFVSDPLHYNLWDAEGSHCYTAVCSQGGGGWDGGNGVPNYGPPGVGDWRLYAESMDGAGTGWFWVDAEPCFGGMHTIHYMSMISQACWPGWAIKHWRFEPYHGKTTMKDVYHSETLFSGLGGIPFITFMGANIEEGPEGITYVTSGSGFFYGWVYQWDRITVWLEGNYGDNLGGDPRRYDIGHIDDWSPGGVHFDIFNGDRAQDRAVVKAAAGGLRLHRWSDHSIIKQLHAPSGIIKVAMDGRGFIHVCDVTGWIVTYDYDGKYLGAVCQPVDTPFMLAFDPVLKRLLRFDFVHDDPADGANRCHIHGYYPIPELYGVTPPIPTRAPRAGVRTPVVSHLYGEGGEPLGGRAGNFTGDVVGPATTDRAGDAYGVFTPAVGGSASATYTVDSEEGGS